MYAIVHTTKVRAALRTGIANVGARYTYPTVHFQARQHYVCRGAAQLGASHHQPKVLRLDMTPACLETVIHRIAPADLIALQTVAYALLHGLTQ